MELTYVAHEDIVINEQAFAKITLWIEEGTGLAVVTYHVLNSAERYGFYYLPLNEADDSLVIQTQEEADAFKNAVLQAALLCIDELQVWWHNQVGKSKIKELYQGQLAADEVELFVISGSAVNELE
jgi:hypothetical protein